jgi:2-amino-4-hydroxy-6-hydroxymethyldihydropteridine diphosphokinase
VSGERVVIGLGGNVGDVLAGFRVALAGLDATPGLRVVAVSPVFRTAPVGPVTQDDFLNAAALVSCALAPDGLLAVVQALEHEGGRVREERWGPRTLDLDVLWWEGRALELPDLVVPHPRLAERRFALAPLVAVAPDAADPDGRPYATVLAGLPEDGVEEVGPPSLVYDPS